MSVKCKIRGHDYIPYRYRWVEFIPTHARTNINRDGTYTLIQVYCKNCGVVKDVVSDDGTNIKYRNVTTK